MRRIVMFNWVSADGWFAAPDGNLSWVVPDQEQAKAAVASMPGSDTMLFGRRTYELFEPVWSRAGDDVDDPHAPGRPSPEHAAIARWMNAATKLVFSRTLRAVTWRNARLHPALDPDEILGLKDQPGKDIMIFGSGSIVSQLTAHGLIDEYQLAVCPVFLGAGRPLLQDLRAHASLALVEAKPYPSGDVLLRYVPARR